LASHGYTVGSAGGAAAFRDSYRDPRVRAVFALAAVFGAGFDSRDLADIRIPVEIVAGAGDKSAPPPTNARRHASLIHGARLLLIPGGVGHYDFVPVCTDAGKRMLDRRLCDDPPRVDRRQVQQKVTAAALEFFGRTLPGAR
jgi:predicted dienelactone hydrolase